MNSLAELLNTAVQHHQAGQLPQAKQLYQQILQQQPHHAGVLNLLGVIACQTGHLTEGMALYRRSLAVQPNFADAHHNLALALELGGEGDAAIAHYQAAIAQQPNNAEAHHNLGNLLGQRGKLTTALAHYQHALRLRPDYVAAHIGVAYLLAQQNQLDRAIAQLQQAIARQPEETSFYLEIAHLCNREGLVDQSLPYLQQALALQPDPQTQYMIGKVLEEQSQVELAIAHFQATLAMLPGNPEAYWHQQLVLPRLYDTAEQIAPQRQRFCRGLNQLIQQLDLTTSTGRRAALNGLGSRTNFYLAYQGLNDRGLQAKYGRLIHQIMAANYPQWVQPIAMPPLVPPQSLAAQHSSPEKAKGFAKAQPRRAGGKIRVGYLSAHLMAHSAAAWARGWIGARDRDQFEVYCYHTSARTDLITQEFCDLSDVLRHMPTDLETIAQQVLADRLHVLIFTDIGMEPQTSQLAGLRLAPVQCTAWGHPVTSGLPTIDYYLSSDLMEPEAAQRHYTERLIRLPNIGICYPQPPLPETRLSRAALGLRSTAIVYLAFQSPYKFLPQYDRVFAEIAQRVPEAQFVFMQYNSMQLGDRWQRRLQQAFATVGLDSDAYCLMLPKLGRADFWSLNLVADVALDAFEWSGGNSTLEAVAYGLPVVTCPGKFMRGRHSAAILQRLGVTETIATTPSEYVEIAARLGLDPDWRRAVSQKLAAGQNRLYDDRECVTALEAFLRQVVCG